MIIIIIINTTTIDSIDVFEEKVMGEDNAPPLVVIGCEGLWGTFLSLLVVYPIAYIMPGSDNGSFEDPFDACE